MIQRATIENADIMVGPTPNLYLGCEFKNCTIGVPKALPEPCFVACHFTDCTFRDPVALSAFERCAFFPSPLPGPDPRDTR